MSAKTQAVLEGRDHCPHCPEHFLLELDTGRCWCCQKTPEEWAKYNETKGVTVEESTSTLTVECEEPEITGDGTGEALPDTEQRQGYCQKYGRAAYEWDPCDDLSQPCQATCIDWRNEAPGGAEEGEASESRRRPDYGVIDKNTGEMVQLSLLGAQWEEYKVETLRLSLSGGDEFVKALFDELVDGELSPGAIVEVVARGVVKEHAPVYKRDGHEGKTVILLEVVRRIAVLGHMTGPVEAAQNVDGEAKVLDEAPKRPECFGEPSEADDSACDECPVLGDCMAAVVETEELMEEGEEDENAE